MTERFLHVQHYTIGVRAARACAQEDSRARRVARRPRTRTSDGLWSSRAQAIMAAIKRIRTTEDPDAADERANEVRRLIRQCMDAAKREIR